MEHEYDLKHFNIYLFLLNKIDSESEKKKRERRRHKKNKEK